MREEDASLALFLDWLAQEHGARLAVEKTELSGLHGLAALASDGSSRLAVEVHPLLEPPQNPAWPDYRDRMEQEIAEELPGAYALWLPPGADLPSGASERADLVKRVRETALRLDPGQRSHVALPVSIFLKKQRDEGSLVSVIGGLNQYWARLSERVSGAYDLDSTRLHRLPESEEHLDRLCGLIWERAARIEAVGQWEELETIDAWTIQRLPRGEGVAIIGRPPEGLGDVSLAVRRNFRRLLADAGPRLGGGQADAQALVVIGYYTRLEEEGASTAMRGYDPTLYSGLEFVCLAADGVIKALMEMRSGALPWT